jgi:serine/threonine protein kinase/tetratricopeptide (TPR) repeat protein
MTDLLSSEKSIFLAALDQESAAQRNAYLDQACGDNAPLRAAVEALLAAHQRLEKSPPLPGGHRDPTADPAIPERPGTMIGPYKLLQPIGEGGMGTVFLAEQTQPVQRKVALKIVKPGMDSKQVLARFEAERQALALMDHPNISKVLDAGEIGEPSCVSERVPTADDTRRLTPLGSPRPYFVMELVKGVPITRYCDHHRLTPKERLKLFVPVCQAVQHAHQKGIIHRDLKPSNVLIALYDGVPVPKVIDFGVAKATGAKLTERTLFTEFGAVIGTLEYMSPEQAELNQLDIDTRSDVYALGVLLYELLTGTTPLDHKRLQNASLLEVLRRIREEEPPAPSTRLGTTEELPAIAANRGLEPKKLSRLVRGELDWIVMKALEKDRNRRYETANGMAQDIQRYLHDEPVQACPPSPAYRLGKLVRRHKGPVLAGALVLLVLVGGMVGTTGELVRALVAEKQALEDRDAKERARQDAVAAEEAERQAKEVAQKRLGHIEKANEVLGSMFRDLDPRLETKEGLPLGAQLARRLDQTAALLEGEAIGDPVTVARLQVILGTAQMNLGYPERAIELLARAQPTLETHLGPDAPNTLICMNALGMAYNEAGQLVKAVQWHEQTLGRRRAKFGPDHDDTMMSLNNLALAYHEAGRQNEALPLFEQVWKWREANRGPNDEGTLTSLNNLALAHQAAGHFDKAIQLDLQALERRRDQLGPDHTDTLTTMSNLATAYFAAGQRDKALPMLQQILERREAKLGPNHPHTLTSLNNLAAAYQDAGQWDKALPMYEQALERRTAKLGPNHPDTLRSLQNLANAHLNAGHNDKALPMLEQALARWTAQFGDDHPGTLSSLNHLGLACRAAGRREQALSLLERALARRTALLGPDHPDTLTSMNNVAQVYQDDRQLDKAIPLFEQALAKRTAQLGPDHPDTLASMNNLALAYKSNREVDRAIPLLEQALEKTKAKLGPRHTDTLSSMNNLALAYQAGGQAERAVPLFEQVLEQMKSRFSLDNPSTRSVVLNLAMAYQDERQFPPAEPLWRELLAWQRQNEGPQSLAAAGTLIGLGQNLLFQQRHAEAETVLRESLVISEQKQPDNWLTYFTRAEVGGTLAGQKQYAEAEPLLLQGYEGMRQRAAKVPPAHRHRFTEVLERLVQLYDAWGKKDQAAEWQKQLEAHKKK